MPGIVDLVAAISLDVARGLVAAGYGLAPLAIIDATNTTPIVIATASAHGYVKPAHVVISGVLGNAAANNLDGIVQSFTVGQNLAVIATPIDDTHLSLSAPDQATGIVAALAGSGAYTSGGTMTPALVDGRILLGREHIAEQSSPPRIVFIPVRSKFGAKSVSGHRQVAPSAERQRQLQQRSIATEKVVFEIHAWGQATPPDPDLDFDATQVLYQQVIQSVHLLTAGAYELVDGAWSDQVATATQLLKAGHEHVFGIAIATPVMDAAQPFVPAGTSAVQTTQLQPADGSPPEISFTG